MEKEKQKSTAPWWQPGLLLFYRLSGWIAGPIIIAIFVGRWLDKKYQTELWIFIFFICIALIVSIIGIGRDVIKEIKDKK